MASFFSLTKKSQWEFEALVILQSSLCITAQGFFFFLFFFFVPKMQMNLGDRGIGNLLTPWIFFPFYVSEDTNEWFGQKRRVSVTCTAVNESLIRLMGEL